MKNSILEIFAENVKKIPERLCVVDETGEYSYEKLWHASKRAAYRLQKAGVKKADCVLVECTQNADYLICYFACNLLGAYFVPIEHHASELNVQTIYEETEAVLLICNKEYRFQAEKCVMSQIVGTDGKELEEWTFPERVDTSEILYTTGTTGRSKGIEISYGNNIAIAENICYGTQMREGNIELMPLPLSHSLGLRCCYANFFKGGTVIIADGVTKVMEIYQLIKKYQVNALDLTPTAASVLLKLSRGRFAEFNEQLDYIHIGSAALSEELKEELRSQFSKVRLYNIYGSTESGRSCALNFNSEEDRKFCIGRPTHNAKFIVTDEKRNEIQSDAAHTGLLACAGAMNMKGYWKMPELTEQILKNGYVCTNDEGYIDEQGYVYILGRKDDVINYNGIKIAPEEIEEVVSKYPGIKDCACVPMADPVAGQVPKIFVALQDGAVFDKISFARFLEEAIDANKIPKQIEVIEEIPRAFNGKIQRKKLMR